MPAAANSAMRPMVVEERSVDRAMPSMEPARPSAPARSSSTPAAWRRAPSETLRDTAASSVPSRSRLEIEALTKQLEDVNERYDELSRQQSDQDRLTREAEAYDQTLEDLNKERETLDARITAIMTARRSSSACRAGMTPDRAMKRAHGIASAVSAV